MTTNHSPRPIALVFGGMGALGRAIVNKLDAEGFSTLVTTTGRDLLQSEPHLLWVDIAAADGMAALEQLADVDIVVWAQGANASDSCTEFTEDIYRRIMSVNVEFVVRTLGLLCERRVLRSNARLCAISSIWQTQARTDKFSYTISKAALGGLVRSAAVDLGTQGIKINAVLPGAIDTPMTRSNLSAAQIERVSAMTPLGRLASPEDVARAVWFLVSPDNRSITGESLRVDGGFSCSQLI